MWPDPIIWPPGRWTLSRPSRSTPAAAWRRLAVSVVSARTGASAAARCSAAVTAWVRASDLHQEGQRYQEGQGHHGGDGEGDARQRASQRGATILKPTPRTVCR